MAIHVKTVADKLSTIKADVLIVPVFKKKPVGTGLTARERTALSAHLKKIDYTGEWGTAEVLALRVAHFPFVALVGLGDYDSAPERQAEGMRRAMGKVVQELRRHLLRSAALTLTNGVANLSVLAAAAVEGAELASYRFTDYVPRLQREQTTRSLQKITVVVPADALKMVRVSVKRAQAILPGVELARHLVNQPASAIPPRGLVEVAQDIAKRHPEITVKIFNRAQAAEAGFNAFLAVARGSQEEPYVIHLTYTPANSRANIFVIGKGITFDSGGLSLKPADMMEAMKIDMAGAAAVLGLFSVLPDVAPAATVHGVIATCENMPSGAAYRPGDIIHAKNGKTIEVLNTDAEGRITLADALSYAVEHKPDQIIDLATLTGACMVALGETVAGLMGNNETMQRELLAAAHRAGEGLCMLPMPEEYKPFIQSRVADVRNIATSKFGGAITAALFLQEFVNGISWAHLDIAGPAYTERPCLPYFDIGATGYGVRLLVEYLQNVTTA